uniref:Reverse transcriptase domain-containing protein n=1 Tax=Haemonchus contortus TaxID=6289 RepID=A0A7I4Z5U9_HAECO
MDDIVVCTTTKERHLELLGQVFARRKEARLRLKALLRRKVSFLGHIVDEEGVLVDPEKVPAIRDYPAPKKVKELRTFLSMESFYRKFCFGSSQQAGPLFNLTSSKCKWSWEKEPRGGVYTRVVKSFKSLRNTLADWTTYDTWIIVLPMERKAEGSTIEESVKIAKTHSEEGGRIATVWTPVTAKTLAEWVSMSILWSTIDATLRKFAGPGAVMYALGESFRGEATPTGSRGELPD